MNVLSAKRPVDLLRGAIEACGGIDGLALTHLDQDVPLRRSPVDRFEAELDVPVIVASHGPTYTDKEVLWKGDLPHRIGR